ncbi:hypothetical protein [Paludibacterium denitrificans]|uniref:hypothetical protein n=1 Tax=Paludibacterium denitrificans TaxID=2675226 RepID=UPI001E64E90C|nr:hypothetical protein [Paludibacterium denitrificans]
MENDIVVQQPANPAQLMLLFHGVGATPQSMQGVGNYLAKGFPNALIVSVAAAAPSDMGAFSGSRYKASPKTTAPGAWPMPCLHCRRPPLAAAQRAGL